ncbi:MAG: MFS transporter [bacterium]|nr:MFS transporter [bacterium]
MKGLPRTVLALGFVSFFTDMSSEMIYPLLPIFLATTLGAGTIALGVIEGVAESTAAVLKVFSGVWTDRTRHRKPLILAGYGLSGLVRPLIGLATVWPFVFAMRFIDRIGKGLRTSPRDALIADVTSPEQRGRAFGLHRSMDHAGAVVGPLVAAALLTFQNISIQHVFLLAAVPALVVLLVITTSVREPASKPASEGPPVNLRSTWHDLSPSFKRLLAALLVFTLGNATDAFLLLSLSLAGVPPAWVAVLWAAHHVVKMLATYFGGSLCDRIGSRTPILWGWTFYALLYCAFGLTTNATMQIGLFMAYGIYFGLTEPAEKAWVTALVPPHLRGTAFGYYHCTLGLGALPASILFGFLWYIWGPFAAFFTGSALAGCATLLLLTVPAFSSPTSQES